MIRTHLFAVAVPFALCFAFGCSPPVQPVACGPSSCTGCCDSKDTCQSGLTDSACGRTGGLCSACNGGSVCALGACTFTATGGGTAVGGGSAGGSTAGGAAAGGSAGGSEAGGSAGGSAGGDAGGSAGGDGGTAGGGNSTAGGSAGGSAGGAAAGGVAMNVALADSFQGEFCMSGYCFESPRIPPTTWNDVFFVSENEGYAVNENGSIARFQNGRWALLSDQNRQPLKSVWATAGVVWAVGVGGTIVQVVGTTFTDRTPSPAPPNLLGVSGTGPNDVWFVGTSGSVLRWDGTSIRPFLTGVTQTLNAVYAASPTSAYAVGNFGRILRFNGVGWSLVAEPSGNNGGYFSAIAGLSASDFVVGGANVFRWNGSAWTQFSNFPFISGSNDHGIRRFAYRAPNDLWAATSYVDNNGGNPNGRLVFWDGLGWSLVESSTNRFAGLASQSASTLWATGLEGGSWLRRTNATIERFRPVGIYVSALAGQPATMLAFSAGVLRRDSAGTWSRVADAGVGLSRACEMGNGDLFGTWNDQFLRLPAGTLTPTPVGPPLDGGLANRPIDVACLGSTAIAATSRRVFMSSGWPTPNWTTVTLPADFLEGIERVPGSDTYWVSESSSTARAFLISDAGTVLRTLDFSTSVSSLNAVLGTASSPSVLVQARNWVPSTRTFLPRLLLVTPPSTNGPDLFARSSTPVENAYGTLKQLPNGNLLEWGIVTDTAREISTADAGYSPVSTVLVQGGVVGVWCVGRTCWVYGDQGQILRKTF